MKNVLNRPKIRSRGLALESKFKNENYEKAKCNIGC